MRSINTTPGSRPQNAGSVFSGITIVVRPSGARVYGNLRLQWRPSRKHVTVAHDDARVILPSPLFRSARSKGILSADSFRLTGRRGDRTIRALESGRPEAEGRRAYLVRVVSSSRQPVTRVSVIDGPKGELEVFRHRRPDLFAAPAGIIELELGNGRSLALDTRGSTATIMKTSEARAVAHAQQIGAPRKSRRWSSEPTDGSRRQERTSRPGRDRRDWRPQPH